jgi:hypothetical protein
MTDGIMRLWWVTIDPGYNCFMDRDREDELMMHLAAGTDLPTAFAALSRNRERQEKSPPSKPSAGEIICAVLTFVAIIL